MHARDHIKDLVWEWDYPDSSTVNVNIIFGHIFSITLTQITRVPFICAVLATTASTLTLLTLILSVLSGYPTIGSSPQCYFILTISCPFDFFTHAVHCKANN